MVVLMNSALLPSSASTLERNIVDAITPDLDIRIRDIWNPQNCPASFLPYLAKSFSVDRWDKDWSESEKRAAIEAAFFVHKYKGTVAAVRGVVEPFGFLLDVIEWWEESPRGAPHTFRLIVGVRDRGITDEMYNQMVDLIYDAKPLRSELLSLDIQAESQGVFFVSAASYSGCITTVYPYEPGTISVYGSLYQAVSEHTFDDVSVYPL
jgi:phage tail P2-like protein